MNDIKNGTRPAFNNVKPKDWYFVLDQVQFRTGLGCVRLINQNQMLWVVDILLPYHVRLPHLLDLAVQLVHVSTQMGLGGHPETFSLEPSFMVKSQGVVGCRCDCSVTPVLIGLGFNFDWFGSRRTGLWTRACQYTFRMHHFDSGFMASFGTYCAHSGR